MRLDPKDARSQQEKKKKNEKTKTTGWGHVYQDGLTKQIFYIQWISSSILVCLVGWTNLDSKVTYTEYWNVKSSLCSMEQTFSIMALITLLAGKFFAVWGCPEHCRMVTSTPGPYTLAINSTPECVWIFSRQMFPGRKEDTLIPTWESGAKKFTRGQGDCLLQEGTSLSLKSSVVAILWGTEMTVGTAAMELGYLNLRKMIKFSTARAM